MSSIEEQLPGFHYFQVGNGYTGNIGLRSYKIITDKSEKKIGAHVYDGPLCYELAVEQKKILYSGEFELSPEGFEQCKRWLAEMMEK